VHDGAPDLGPGRDLGQPVDRTEAVEQRALLEIAGAGRGQRRPTPRPLRWRCFDTGGELLSSVPLNDALRRRRGRGRGGVHHAAKPRRYPRQPLAAGQSSSPPESPLSLSLPSSPESLSESWLSESLSESLSWLSESESSESWLSESWLSESWLSESESSESLS
jgi:hypothetical protein